MTSVGNDPKYSFANVQEEEKTVYGCNATNDYLQEIAEALRYPNHKRCFISQFLRLLISGAAA